MAVALAALVGLGEGEEAKVVVARALAASVAVAAAKGPGSSQLPTAATRAVEGALAVHPGAAGVRAMTAGRTVAVRAPCKLHPVYIL